MFLGLPLLCTDPGVATMLALVRVFQAEQCLYVDEGGRGLLEYDG